jgi:hypothetical protein
MPSVYGEWLYTIHTIEYHGLPDYFLAFDFYDPERGLYIDSYPYREILSQFGVRSVPQLYRGKVTEKILLEMRDGPSQFNADQPKEGIYVRVVEDGIIKNRYKMVRPSFKPGERFDKKELKKNHLAK